MDAENFTIVIPTLLEVKNITDLIKRISQVNFGKRQFEVILVDDNSQDGTAELVQALSSQYSWLKIRIRQKERNLSASIIEGFQNAIYPLLLSMDADLSHPPEKIPDMLNALAAPDVDFVIGSRYISGGSTDPSWPFSRKLISRFAALIANTLIFSNTQIKDPLSGFCALRKDTFLTAKSLNTIGWKIGLEMIVKCQCKHVKEIPIHFAERSKGNSKLTFKIAVNYLQQIRSLMRQFSK